MSDEYIHLSAVWRDKSSKWGQNSSNAKIYKYHKKQIFDSGSLSDNSVSPEKRETHFIYWFVLVTWTQLHIIKYVQKTIIPIKYRYVYHLLYGFIFFIYFLCLHTVNHFHFISSSLKTNFIYFLNLFLYRAHSQLPIWCSVLITHISLYNIGTVI